MPVTVRANLRRLSQEEFAEVAFETMRHVFDVHNEFGRLFDESIYHCEVAARCKGVSQVPVEVTHAGFRKFYFLDLLVGDGAIFELKAADGITPRHRAQLLNYLLLTDLAHGKVVNVRRASVEHEFMNTTLRAADRTDFAIDDQDWDFSVFGAGELRLAVEKMLRDLGTGLELPLYQEFVTWFLGGQELIERQVGVIGPCSGRSTQKLLFAAPDTAFRFSSIRDEECPSFREHLMRFVSHTTLRQLHWINVAQQRVSFKTLRRDG